MSDGVNIAGMVIAEDEYEGVDVPAIGDTIDMHGQDHVVVGKTGTYQVERDEWEVVVKLEPLRDPRIPDDEPPEWVRKAVFGHDSPEGDYA